MVPKILSSQSRDRYYVTVLAFSCKTSAGVNCSAYAYDGFATYARSFFTRQPPKRAEEYGSDRVVSRVEALVDSDSTVFDYNTDDSYELKITPNAAQIKTRSEMGVSRALATLTQLITETDDPTSYTVEGGQFNDNTSVHWRHYYVDACSHFMSVEDVGRVVDAASLQKLNTLILEIGCGPSIGVLIDEDPVRRLANGAFTSAHYYSVGDMRRIQEHARAMGVVVVPKISLPGRTGAWRHADSRLVACAAENPNQVALDPFNEEVYKYIEQLTDGLISGFFPADLNVTPVIYFGGDKVVFSCWEQNQGMRDQLNALGGSRKAWQYF